MARSSKKTNKKPTTTTTTTTKHTHTNSKSIYWAVLQVWPKPSFKARWEGEEDKADRGRGGKLTSEEWTGLEFAKSKRSVENGGKWKKLVAKSSVVPQRPARLRDRWWWWCLRFSLRPNRSRDWTEPNWTKWLQWQSKVFKNDTTTDQSMTPPNTALCISCTIADS